MKITKILTSGAAFMLPLLSMGETVTISEYLVASPVEINLPAMSDSIGVGGKKFNLAALLDTKSNADVRALNAGIVTAVDTTGLIEFRVPEEGVALTMVQTSAYADRYMKGRLYVASPEIFEVKVNDTSMQKKSALQDSLDAASEIMVELELKPMINNKIDIRLLSDNAKGGTALLKARFEPEEKYADVPVTFSPDTKRRFSIDDTEAGRRVRYVKLSPDGKYLALYYREKYTNEYTRTWADIVRTDDGSRVAANLKYQISWAPKGSTLYYTEQTKNGYDVYTLDIPSMRHECIIKDIPDASFYWSPDMDYLIYYVTDEGKQEAGPLRRYTSPDDRIPGNRRRATMMKYDVATGISTPMVYSGAVTYLMDISNDGKKILYMTQTETPSQYPFYCFDVIEMDVATFATDTIISKDAFFSGGIYSPDAKQIFAWAGPAFHGGIGLVSPQNRPNDYDKQGFIIDIATKNVTAMTRDFNPSIDNVLGWNAKDGKIYFTAQTGFYVKPYALNPRTGEIREVASEVGNVLSASIGQYEDTWLAMCENGNEYAGRAWLMNLRSGKQKSVDAPLDAYTSQINWGEGMPWNFTASDGTVIEGMCILPPDFDESKKYPLIVYYYGGCSPSQVGSTSPYSAQLFASRDYVVYVLNPSGTTGYGQDFSARHVNAWGKITADEIIEGTKKFCEQHPYVDSKKIGCIGASYGGFMTQYLLTKTDIFTCAVSHAGISNVASYWGEGFWGYSYNAVAASESYPWNNPELFTRQGSLFNADKIHTPLLLLHGTADTNVPIGESIQLFNALRILDRDVEFISVEGENHFISDFAKRKLWHDSIMAWFAKYLQDDSRWWDSIYGGE